MVLLAHLRNLKETAEHINQRLAARCRAQLGECAFEPDLSLMKQAEAVAQALGLVQSVCADDHGLSFVA